VGVTVLRERWRAHPLAWIHRAEARALAAELARAGRAVTLALFDEKSVSALPPGALLRLSDPVMLRAVHALERAAARYLGPSAAVMERCYDKHEAYRSAVAHGIDTPATALAGGASDVPTPRVLKPRRGSDSLGLRMLGNAEVPAARRNSDHLVQEQVRGLELTVAVLHGRAGLPIAIELPEGVPYTFARKYFSRPQRGPLADAALAARVREEALRIAAVFAVDWAARIDLIVERASGRVRFLECDVAPLVGPHSAFAESLAAGGVTRAEQLALLLRGD